MVKLPIMGCIYRHRPTVDQSIKIGLGPFS